MSRERVVYLVWEAERGNVSRDLIGVFSTARLAYAVARKRAQEMGMVAYPYRAIQRCGQLQVVYADRFVEGGIEKWEVARRMGVQR